MIRRQKLEAARAIMAKIYAHATPEQVDLKVCITVVNPCAYIDQTDDDECRLSPWQRR